MQPDDAGDVGHVDDEARLALTANPRARRLRRMWRALPSAPRCKMCTSPFGPPMGPVLALIGKSRWPGNPKYCRGCFRALYTRRAGAEVEASFLFADIRGSTQLAEAMPASRFRELVDRFYALASEVLVAHEAVVDKFVGDEVIGIFVPALTGSDHARRAVDAGRNLLEAVQAGPDATRAPIGIGVNSGRAYVGAVGTEDHVEFTALGDPVNVAARLASAANAGELVASEATVLAAGVDTDGIERRELTLKGKSDPVIALVVTS